MSDETFVIKVPEELKDQVNNLIKESGSITVKAFMQSIINIYVVEKTKERVFEIDEELKELEILKQRIDSIYFNLDHRVEDVTKTAEEKDQLFNKKNIVNIIISSLQQEQLDLQESHENLLSKNNDITSKNIEYFEKFNQLTNCDIKILNEEFKTKVNSLERVLKQFDKYPQELEMIKLLLSEAHSIDNPAGIQIKKQTKNFNLEIDNLEKYLSVIKADQNNLISDLKDKFAKELRLQKDIAAETEEKALLKLKSKYEIQTQIIENKHNKVLEQFQIQAQSLENKYNKLIKEYQKQAQIAEAVHNKTISKYEIQTQTIQYNYDKLILGYQKQLENVQEGHAKEIEAYRDKYNDLLNQLDTIKKLTKKLIME